MVFSIITVFILLILSAFFSSSETVLYLIKDYHIQNSKHNKEKFSSIKKNQDNYLSLILFSNTIVNIFIGLISESLGFKILGESANIFIIIGLTTLILLIFGEIMPKRFGIISYAKIFPFYFSVLEFLYTVFNKIVATFNLIVKPFRKIKKEETRASIDEIRLILIDGFKNKIFSETQLLILLKLLSFSNYKAHHVMIPYNQIESITMDSDFDQVKEIMGKAYNFKIPVLDKNKDSIMGYIDIRDMISDFENEENSHPYTQPFMGEVIRDIMQPPLIVYENEDVHTIIQKITEKKEDFIFVIDEHFQFQGIIVLYRMIESILALDQKRFSEQKIITCDSDISLYDLKYLYMIDLPKKYRTFYAFLREHSPQQILQKGLEIKYKNINFKIVNINKNNRAKVEIWKN